MTQLDRLGVAQGARIVAVISTALVGLMTLSSACAGKSSSMGPGAECFVATDCAPGLVCIEQPNKTRICSDDLSQVTGQDRSEAGPAEMDASSEVPVPDGSVPEVEVPEDSGAPDATDPPDTGSPDDAGDDGGG